MGDRAIGTAELGDMLLRWNPDVAADALARLVTGALVESEAAREGVEPPDAAVEAAVERALDERLRRLRLEHGAGTDVGALLLRRWGRTLDGLREDLRRAVRTDLRRERLARLDALRRDGFLVHVLVLPDERTAARAAAEWRTGADGGAIARRLGARPPETPPAAAPEDVPDPALRARLAAASAGDVLGPVPFEAPDPERVGDALTWWQVFRVVAAWRATDRPWTELAETVEASIRDRPPDAAELAAWEARVRLRVGVRAWNEAVAEPSAPGR